MAFPGTGKIWMNGKFVDWADAHIHIASHVIHYGSGVFEGARCYDTVNGPACFRLDAHMKRLMSYRQAMLDDFAALYAEKFTLEELRQVTDFYRSPAGAKFVQAVPELIQAGAQIGIKYSRKAMETSKP